MAGRSCQGGAVIDASDEQPHLAGPELRWMEAWTFDFAADDASVGGWLRLALLPNAGVAWYHGYLTGPGRQLVAVIDTEVPPPPGSLEIRTTGLWATHICETPLDHWTVGLEAFGLGVDDPVELYGRQFGDQVPLGFDLEWEATGPARDASVPAPGYDQACVVSGEVLVGRERIDLLGHGWRAHHWGAWSGWDRRHLVLRGRLDDGTTVACAVAGGDLTTAGAAVGDEAVPVSAARETMGGPGMPRGAEFVLGSLTVEAEAVGVTPLELTDVEGRVTTAPRALCRLSTSDGRRGAGWVEWNLPQR